MVIVSFLVLSEPTSFNTVLKYKGHYQDNCVPIPSLFEQVIVLDDMQNFGGSHYRHSDFPLSQGKEYYIIYIYFKRMLYRLILVQRWSSYETRCWKQNHTSFASLRDWRD